MPGLVHRPLEGGVEADLDEVLRVLGRDRGTSVKLS
jgi:hypothetical protein